MKIIPMDKINLINNDPIPFYEYLEKNPHLWDNVEGLTDTEKAFINMEFYDYNCNPTTIGRELLHRVDKYIDQYLELKALNLSDKLKDVTTNERLRTIINSEATNLQRNGTVTHSSTGTESESHSVNGNTKQADRALPMNSSGEDLDDIVDWSKGASTAGESKTRSTDTVTGSNSINGSDIQALTDLGTRNANGTITDKEMNEAAVDIINRIWNYYSSKNPLEWLCNKLEPCFICVW